MNPNTPPPSDDDLPDERELAALYARLPRAEPGDALDAAVLAQAARVVPVRRRPRWPVALGSAAVLILAVGVAWQVRDTSPPSPAGRSAAPSSSVYAPKAVPLPAPAAPTEPPSAPVPAPPPQSSPAAPAVSMAPVEPAPPAASREATLRRYESATAADRRVSEVGAVQAVDRLDAGQRAPGLAPDDRVGEIRRLLDHGRRDEALRRLRELRRLYPRYDLPQDLRDLNP
jgi:hypothetical protein